MDIAKITETNEIISNIDLTLMAEEQIKRLHYQCPECEISLSPASYRPQNIRAPYFTPASKTNYHYDDCLFNDKKSNLKKYQTTNYSSTSDIPFKFPNGLNLQEPGIGIPRGKQAELHTTRETQVNYKASSLFAICRTYLLFPKCRRIMPLSIHNISGNTYQTCFSRVKFDISAQSDKILFGLSFWNSLNFDQSIINISLLAWDQSTSSSKKVSLQINCAQWTERTKNSFIKEFKLANQAAKDAYKNKLKYRTYIFFIGEQDANDFNLFHIFNRKLISIISTDM